MYKIYIAGAIKDNPTYIKEFLEAEETLEKKGFKVLTPIRTFSSENALPPKFCFFEALELLKQADMVCFINDITKSKGSKIEMEIANYCNIPIINYELLKEGGFNDSNI